MAILSKACTPDNFELHNSRNLSFENIQGLPSNFVYCNSFLESNSPDILVLCEIKLDNSIDYGNFYGRLSYFNLKGFYYSYTWSCSYVKEGLPFTQDLSLENSADS